MVNKLFTALLLVAFLRSLPIGEAVALALEVQFVLLGRFSDNTTDTGVVITDFSSISVVGAALTTVSATDSLVADSSATKLVGTVTELALERAEVCSVVLQSLFDQESRD